MLQQVVYSQNTVFYTCNCSYWSGGQSRSSAPASSRPEARGGADPGGCLWCRARVWSGVRECARAGTCRQGGASASNSLRREFEGNFGVPFERNSKGTRRVMEPLRVVSGTSCNNHLLALPRTVARSLRRNSKKNRRRRSMHSRRRRRLGTGFAVSEGANSNN